MDLMQIRRRMMLYSGKTDYLKDVEWVENKYINVGGAIGDSVLLKYTESIRLPAGAYIFAGTIGPQGPVNTRIHAYDAEDKWIRQLILLNFPSDSSFSKEITVPNGVYAIRISTGITVEATLTKA